MPFCPECRCELEAGHEVCPDCGAALVATLPPGEEEPDERLVDIFGTQDASEAVVVLAMLRANDIQCNDHSGVPQNVLPLHVDRMEEIRITVREDDADAARALIAQREPSE